MQAGVPRMNLRSLSKSARCCIGLLVAALGFVSATPAVLAQSQSGFVYNGLNYASYQANEYLNSSSAASAMRATGANYAGVVVTQYVQTSTSNTIAPETATSPGYSGQYALTPTDSAVVSAIQSLQAQGLVVTLKPHVDSLDGVFRGSFKPSNVSAWFASYQTFILHYAQIASQNNVGTLVIGTELASLTGPTYKSYWETIITALRTQYPNLTLIYGANATSSNDEFTTVSFWADVDVIGVDGYFPLTNQTDPTVSALVAAWTNNKSGFNIVTALKNLQSTYNKPLIFTEIGYVSVSGTNEQPYASIAGNYDATEQQNCYEAFFQVFSAQSSWMKGVFWWDWSPSAPSANDTGYSPQNKPAGTVTLPKWFSSTTAGFTIAPALSTVALGQGLATTNVISVTAQGGFNGAVSLAVSGLPNGVTGAFAAGTAPGTQVLTLQATSSAALAGPVAVTVTGTSGTLTASTSFNLSVVAASTQTITFNNPGAQTVGNTFGLTATASSGLPVTFVSSTLPVCTVGSSTGVATFAGTGTCTITASQAGNGTYSAATPVSVSFNVAPLSAVPVPAADNVVVSQVNWVAPLGGYAYASGNPAGSSFAVNGNGAIVVANSNNVVLFNAQTGAATTLGAWSSASALTVDSKNNIYVGNPYGPVNSIVKLPYVGGLSNGGYAAFTTPTAATPICTASSTAECLLPSNLGAVNPAALAFDATGNLFYTTASSGFSGGNSIYECNVACLGGTGSPLLIYSEPKAANTPSANSGQLLAGALALDSAGNLFFSDSSIYVNSSSYAITSFFSNLNELPVSTGAGYGGVATGFAASPTVLYTVTPSPVGTYDNELDGVVVLKNSGGDTVYFADQNTGIFAFPDSPGGIPLAGGKPTAMYTVASQGAKTLSIDSTGNLYLAAYSSALGTGGDTLAKVTLNSIAVPASAVGTAVSPSSTVNPVTAFVNDATCTSAPAPAVSFVASASSTATATASTSGGCSTTLSGGGSFPTSISFTPSVAGPGSVNLTAKDQAGSVTTVVVNGTGSGFTLSSSAPTLSVAQGANATSTISIADQGTFTGNVTLAATGLPTGVTAAFTTNPTSTGTVVTLTAAANAVVGGPVTVTITGTSGANTASTTIALTVVTPPSFTLAPTSSALTVVQGSSSTDSITINAANGFTGSVTFSASGLPSGVTASFSPNPTTGSSTVLTLTAAAGATTGGPTTVTVSATSGGSTQSTPIALTVNVPPGFTLSASPSTIPLLQGGTATSTVSINATGGFNSAVTLAATGLPSGVTASFATNPATGSSVVTFTGTATAATGPATVTIAGTSGTITASTRVALTVSVPPSFSLTAATPALTIVQGKSATDTITITPANGFTGNVTFTATGLPSGVTATFAANPAAASTVLTLSASSTATAGGPVSVTVNGVSGTIASSTTVMLTVNVPPSFTLVASPATVSVAQTATATGTVTITSLGGFNGTVALAATGLPTGVTASFAAGTTAGTQVVTFTASAAATIVGPVTVTISGTSGTLAASTTVALSVIPTPSFTFSGADITVHHGAGILNSSVISIAATNGFTGTVALTCAITPTAASNPPTCTLSPTSVTLTGTTAQTSTLTVTTTGGSLVQGKSPLQPWLYGGSTTLAMMCLFLLPKRRRQWPTLLALILSLGAIVGAVGCSTNSPVSTASTGTSVGAYTVTITGTSGSTKASGSVNLNVQ